MTLDMTLEKRASRSLCLGSSLAKGIGAGR